MRRHLVVFAAASAFLCATLSLARPIPAQKFQPKTIQFKGDPEYTDQELLDAAGLKKGVVLTTEEMNAAAERLMGSGVFDQLAYKFDGQDLIFSMTPATELYPVRLDNLPLMPGPDLDAKLHSRLPLYHSKVPSDGTLLNDVCGAFEDMLAAEGVHAKVTAEPYGDQKQHNKVTAMSFSIKSPPVRIGAVQIEGASADLLPKLQSLAASAAHDSFDSNNSLSALEHRFVSFYLNRGYAAVKVNLVQSGSPQMTADAIQVPYTATVEEGRVYKTGWIHVPAGGMVTQDEADKLVASHQSQTTGEPLESVQSLINQRYKSKGYLDLVTTPHPEFNDASATVNYTIEIVPGAVYHLGFIKFDNVSDDLRGHLIRAWQLMPGDVFDETYLDIFLIKAQSEDPVLKRSLFGAGARTETSSDPVTHEVDVVMRLEK